MADAAVRRSVAAALLLATALLTAAGCSSSGAGSARTADDPPLPPVDATFDYQLGGAYDTTVAVVARDRTDPPAGAAGDDVYDICYVNGFQTQPGEADDWPADLLLRDERGDVVIDAEWPDEVLVDITTPERRAAVASIVGDWIAGCAADGFDAVEIDNLDTYARSAGAISPDDAVATIRLLAQRAHAEGLAIGQKNAAELLDRVDGTGLDFAVVEQCHEYDECDAFADAYDDHVLVIEYDEEAFTRGCAEHPDLSVVLRDVELRTDRDPGYRYESC